MNDYASLKKQNSSPFFAVVALLLCVVLSASVLFGRLVAHTAQTSAQRIPLTVSNGVTKVTQIQRESTQHSPAVTQLSARVMPLDETETNPGFQVEDASTVWEGQTDVEIFRVAYENGQGQVTVNSATGDKVLAPGTENEYRFTLHNTGDVDLDYTLEIAAWFSDGQTAIPVVVRLLDYEDKYLLGSPEGYADVLELNSVKEENSISAGYIAPYTLQWQWPFEGDDEYDTWLGNLAQDTDITLTIAIRTTAQQGSGGGLPDTGDRGITLAAVVMVGSLGGLLVIALLPKRRREERNGRG